ncbi:MAG TPA: PAS domain S-box protein [Deltaproteobacteria bacterium]|nr:PAS domain S-box protein [Deltaproteobacteria bacterium]
MTVARRSHSGLRDALEQQRVINEILTVSMDRIPFDEQLGRILDRLLSLPWLPLVRKGAIFLADDEDPQTLVLRTSVGLTPDMERACRTVPVGKCLCGEAAATGRIVFVDRVDESHVIRYEGIQPHGHYCVPVRCGERTLGVLTLYVREGHSEQQSERDFLAAAAHTLAGIIERHRAEQALRESEARYRLLFENESEAVIIVDARTLKIEDANNAAQKLFGYTKDELIGLTSLKLAGPAKRSRAALERLFRRRPGSTATLTFQRKDGTVFPGEMKAGTFTIDARTRIIGSVRDDTERTRLEKERERLYAQLLHSQKMEAVGRLAGGIAHDFNNIQTAIKTLSHLGMKRSEPGAQCHELFGQILKASQRATELTRQLLLFSRSEPASHVPLCLNKVITALTGMLAPLIGESYAIKVENDSALKPVSADRGNMEQVITNLVVNARDAMPEGGTITIRTENVVLGRSDCNEMAGSRPGSFVKLTVEDRGAGISDDELERIFEPFYTTKKSGTGSGLGLTVVYGIVRDHGGWINVRSAPGEGSAFEVYLPAASVQPPDELDAPLPLSGGGAGKRILVVEDDDMVRETAAMVLEDEGYEVACAATAAEALALFKERNGAFQVVISDYVLPDRDGMRLIDELRGLNPAVKVILNSGYMDNHMDKSKIRRKGIRFIRKPYDVPRLLALLAELTGEGGA